MAFVQCSTKAGWLSLKSLRKQDGFRSKIYECKMAFVEGYVKARWLSCQIYDPKQKHQELHTLEGTIVPRTVIFFSLCHTCYRLTALFDRTGAAALLTRVFHKNTFFHKINSSYPYDSRAYINHIQKIFFLGQVSKVKKQGFLHCRLSLSPLMARLRAGRVKIVKNIIFDKKTPCIKPFKPMRVKGMQQIVHTFCIS